MTPTIKAVATAACWSFVLAGSAQVAEADAPEWSGRGSAIYEFQPAALGTVAVRGDVSWLSRVFFSPFNETRQSQSAYALVHARTGVDLLHRHHHLEGTLGLSAAGRKRVGQRARSDLPGNGGVWWRLNEVMSTEPPDERLRPSRREKARINVPLTRAWLLTTSASTR